MSDEEAVETGNSMDARRVMNKLLFATAWGLVVGAVGSLFKQELAFAVFLVGALIFLVRWSKVSHE